MTRDEILAEMRRVADIGRKNNYGYAHPDNVAVRERLIELNKQLESVK